MRYTIIDLLTGRQLAQVDFLDEANAIVKVLDNRGFVPRLQLAAGDTPVARLTRVPTLPVSSVDQLDIPTFLRHYDD